MVKTDQQRWNDATDVVIALSERLSENPPSTAAGMRLKGGRPAGRSSAARRFSSRRTDSVADTTLYPARN
jgi:hypothetical protein